MKGLSAFASATALLLSACGALETETETPVVWKQLADGSSFGQVTIPSADPASTYYQKSLAARCWPSESDKFTCLVIRDDKDGSLLQEVSRRSTNRLPNAEWMDQLSDGYSCQLFPGPRENIIRSGELLNSNDLITGARERWEGKFVRKYMRDNQVGGTPYFPCLDVMSEVLKGSVVTLGTTSITKEMAFGSASLVRGK